MLADMHRDSGFRASQGRHLARLHRALRFRTLLIIFTHARMSRRLQRLHCWLALTACITHVISTDMHTPASINAEQLLRQLLVA
jgi:hypothetical protein